MSEDTRYTDSAGNVYYTATSGTITVGAIDSANMQVTTDGTGNMTFQEVIETPVESKPRPKKPTLREETRQTGDLAQHQKITRDQILICKTDSGIRILTHDWNGERRIRDIMNYHTQIKAGKQYPSIRNFLLFDKNMNHVVVKDEMTDPQSGKIITKGIKYPRVPHLKLGFGSETRGGLSKKWLIVDRDEFVNSNGRRLKVISQNVDKHEKADIKKKLLKEMNFARQAIDMLKSVVSSVYDQDNFEIIYGVFPSGYHSFNIFVQYPNLVIKNSIEMEHTVGNLITRLKGSVAVSSKLTSVQLENYISGMRTHYTERDAISGYSHSHISSGTYGFGAFCMGERHFLNNVSRVTPLDLEGRMVAMFDHVSWESLEGGPHFRMEKLTYKNDKERREYSYFHRPTPELSYLTSASLIREIISHIKEKDLTELKRCFTASFENEGVGVTVNYERFMLAFINLFTEEKLNQLFNDYRESTRFYEFEKLPMRVQLYSLSSRREKSDFKHILRYFLPVYMNGKYVRPQIQRETKKEKKENELLPIFNPQIIDHIAATMCGIIFENIKLYNNDEKAREKIILPNNGTGQERDSDNTGSHLHPNQLSSQPSW